MNNPSILKRCIKCNQEKSAENFSINRETKDRLKPQCRECDNKIAREHYRKNRDKRIEQVKKWQKEQKAAKIKSN